MLLLRRGFLKFYDVCWPIVRMVVAIDLAPPSSNIPARVPVTIEMSPHTSRRPPVTFTCSNSGSWQSKPNRTLELSACERKKNISHNSRAKIFISHNIRMSSKSISFGLSWWSCAGPETIWQAPSLGPLDQQIGLLFRCAVAEKDVET